MASPPWCRLLSLPDEMVLNCFARVSRLDLAALSMLSKRCRSIVLSPDLYETRSLMGFTEESVYVFIESPGESNPLWFILNRVKENSSENRLIQIDSFPTPEFSSLVAFGGGIYVIGGLIDSEKTRFVSFLDCLTHTWSYLPSMKIARARAEVGVLNGKIYVIGGCDMNSNDLSNWSEVFDPKMQTWSGVNIQDPEIKHGIWNMDVMQSNTYKKGYSDIKRLLYYCNPMGNIMWCEPRSEMRQGRMNWRNVYGLDIMQKSFNRSSELICCFAREMADEWHGYMLKHGYIHSLSLPRNKLSTSDGNIIIFWNKFVAEEPKRMEIWCTEISIERRERGEVWGTVQWSEHVYTVDYLPYRLTVLQSVSVAV